LSYSIKDMKLTSVAISLFLKIPLPYLPLFFFHLSPSSQEETSDMKFKKTRTFVGSSGLWGAFFLDQFTYSGFSFFTRSYALILVPYFCGWILCSGLSHHGGLQVHWCINCPSVGFKLCGPLLLGWRLG